MRILRQICLTTYQLAKQAWFLPQSIIAAVRQRREAATRSEFEIERLDRIRDPEKYRGKY